MISLIICSRAESLSSELENNIRCTIGVPYEIVFINNKDNFYSILSAYNKGAEQSLYDLLCFMHDDIYYETSDWGNTIVKSLSNNLTGLIGVAGAKVKTRNYSPWWVSNFYDAKEFLRYNIIQYRKGEWMHECHNPENTKLAEVVVVDGVWFCCRKDVWERTRFDEINLKGFHFYDLDYSLGVASQGLKNYVTYDILFKHASAGRLEQSWLVIAEQFHKKWEKNLPVSVHPMSRKDLDELEYQAIINNLLLSIKYRHGSVLAKFLLWSKAMLYKRPSVPHLKLLYNIIKFF
ncbi:hypothetical protein GCM10027443_13850 [Pontibacter brevis]